MRFALIGLAGTFKLLYIESIDAVNRPAIKFSMTQRDSSGFHPSTSTPQTPPPFFGIIDKVSHP